MMSVTAKDIMRPFFHALSPETPLDEAVKRFKLASREEGLKVFGMVVLDNQGHLVGMISMYDILLFMKPKHTHIWGMMEDIEIAGIIDIASERLKEIFVGDIMTPDVITITPETHLLVILDIMIKKHVRRLPVLEGGQIKGIVYISDLFFNLLEKSTE